MMANLRSRGRRRGGFTLIELLVVMAIIAVLASILLPAISGARAAADRSKCSNNLRQVGIACLTFESAYKGLPRAGEHLVTPGTSIGGYTSGTTYKTQDPQSPFIMILPFIDQTTLAQGYDMTLPYNAIDSTIATISGAPGATQNAKIAKTRIPFLNCPSNPLANFRSNGNFDSAGYACTDYTTVPYVELTNGPNTYLRPSALTGTQYADSNYQDYNSAAASSVDSAVIGATKALQLVPTALPDPYVGLAKISDITDGASNTLMLYEDVGRNEQMNGTDSTGSTKNEYFDPSTLTRRHHWRWADPDTASGNKRGINNNRNGSMDGPDANGDAACTSWRVHDCGPNNEAFSFHPGNGAHVVFADGHVVFLRATISKQVVWALGTRSNGKDTISGEANTPLDGIND